MNTICKHIMLCSAVLALCLIPAVALAGATCKVQSVRHWSSDDYSRVVVDVSGNAVYKVNRLKNPDRLYVDINQSEAAPDACGDIEVRDGLLKRVRAAQFDSDTVRVVLDVMSMNSYKVFQLNDPPRLVIDVYGDEAPSRDTAPPVPVFTAKRVVLDPGHGGKDPGASSYGLQEKRIVLDISRRVKRILDKKGGYEVILTRDNDTFLSLEERTVFANTKKADLFVSIHVNANTKRSVRGLETYMLNFTDDEEAMKVAARENKISLKRMKETRSEVGAILASLELQNKRDESLKLANYIQESMVSNVKGKYSRIKDHGVRQALFYVLFGAHMPSVLVEASYITNREEAIRLKSARYREYLARGIADGIEEYLKKSEPVQEVARR